MDKYKRWRWQDVYINKSSAKQAESITVYMDKVHCFRHIKLHSNTLESSVGTYNVGTTWVGTPRVHIKT